MDEWTGMRMADRRGKTDRQYACRSRRSVGRKLATQELLVTE